METDHLVKKQDSYPSLISMPYPFGTFLLLKLGFLWISKDVTFYFITNLLHLRDKNFVFGLYTAFLYWIWMM